MNTTNAEYAQNRNWSGRGTLDQLVAELDRQKKSKVDFVADTRSVRIEERDGGLFLVPTDTRAENWFESKKGYLIKVIALEQIGEKCLPNVPTRFVREMAEKRPTRLAVLLNGLMEDEPGRRLIRVLDGQVRAFLSDRYRMIDHYDIAYASLDAVRASGGEVIEASLDDKKMRLKFTSRQIFDAINLNRQGDKSTWYAGGLGSAEYLQKVHAHTGGNLPGGPGTVHPLATISNSETGHGGYNVRVGLLQAICFNLATVEDVVGEVHLGSKLSLGVFSDATLNVESKAIFMKVRDVVRAAFTQETFKKMVEVAKSAHDKEIKAPTSAIENIAKEASISDEAKDSLLRYFIRDYEMTNYGLAQAVARLAQDVTDTERAADLEDVAGKILRMKQPVA
jgi:hypothetical protein